MNESGFYSVAYQGVAGWGAGMIAVSAGTICGADAMGGQIDGTYTSNPASGKLDADITWTATASMPMVQGVTVPKGYSMSFKAALAKGLAIESPMSIQTPMGPITVILKKVRDLH